MKKIFETKDYDKFELHEFNRSVSNLDRLLELMKKYGWIDAHPMHVIENGNTKLKIKDGHHRFEAARLLGIPVKYVICKDDVSIHELDQATRHWSMMNYLESFSRIGNTNYLKLYDFYKKFRIPLNVSVTLMGGKSANESGFHSVAFKQGKFKVINPTHAYTLGDLVMYLDSLGVSFCRNSRFIVALSKVMHVDGISIDELKYKIENHVYMMQKQPDVNGYIVMLEKVYNRQRSKNSKLAIAINAV
jgi:hypothetical protein